MTGINLDSDFDARPHTVVNEECVTLRTNYVMPSLQDAGVAVANVAVKLANKAWNTVTIMFLAADMAGTRPIKRILVEYEDPPIRQSFQSPRPFGRGESMKRTNNTVSGGDMFQSPRPFGRGESPGGSRG